MKPWEQAATTLGPASQGVIAAANSPLPVMAATNIMTNTFSGGEVLGLSALLNMVVQPIKMAHWFKQDRLMVPLLLVIGVGLAILVVWLMDPSGDWRKAVAQGLLKGGSAAWQAAVNYSGVGPNGLGLLKAGTD